MDKQILVSYMRVSTDGQGKDGYGIEAQRKSIMDYAANNNAVVVKEYVEVCSGKKNKPMLNEAVALVKKLNATMVFMRVDRISRKASESIRVLEEIKWVATDQLYMNNNIFTANLFCILAQEEAKLISIRTKQALSAAKSRGVELGKYSKVLSKQQIEAANEYANSVRKHLEPMVLSGYSANAIAEYFNTTGVKSMRGGKWQATQIINIRNRLGLSAS